MHKVVYSLVYLENDSIPFPKRRVGMVLGERDILHTSFVH